MYKLEIISKKNINTQTVQFQQLKDIGVLCAMEPSARRVVFASEIAGEKFPNTSDGTSNLAQRSDRCFCSKVLALGREK